MYLLTAFLLISVDICEGLHSWNAISYKEAILGEETMLECNIEVDPNNEWHHIAVDSVDIIPLMLGAIHRQMSPRFSVHASGSYDLVIAPVEKKDAGTYICMHYDKEIIRITLTVLESLPDCSFSLSSKIPLAENSCGLEPDIVSLTCSVRYSGVVAPVLKWVDIGGKNHSRNTQKEHHKVVNIVHANVTWNKILYTCLSKATEKSCHTVIPNPEYVFNTTEERSVSRPETVICSANSSQVCSYEWIHHEKRVSNDEKLELLPESPSGEYQCMANCWLYGRHCSILAYQLTYVLELNNHCLSDWWLFSNVITAIVVILLVLGVNYFNRNGYIQRKITNWTCLRQVWRFIKSPWTDIETKQLSRQFDIPGRVKGIAVLDKLIILSTFEKKAIDCFSTETYEHRKEIPVRGLKEARGMAACQRKKFVYLTDRIGCDVIRINIEQMETYHWTTKSNPDGISVTKDTHVVVACPLDNAVKVFTFEGEELRTIHLPSENLGHLYHGWQMKDSNFLVCYGPESDDPGEHQHTRICIVEPGETATERYINKAMYPGADKVDVIWPMRVAETRRGGVLVISSVDKMVLLFDSNLKQFKVLIHTSDKFLLNRMCLDEEHHRLYITERSEDWLSSRILIYELTDDELDASLDVPNTSSNDPLLNR